MDQEKNRMVCGENARRPKVLSDDEQAGRDKKSRSSKEEIV